MGAHVYPVSDDEPRSVIPSYTAKSYTTAILVYHGEWEALASEGSWTESSSSHMDILKDEATGDTMYLKMGQLERRIESSEDRIKVLEEEMDVIRSHFMSVSSESEVRELPMEEVKEIIRNHVEKHGDFWPDQLALEHNLSVWSVLDAVEGLAEEGYLEAKDRNAVPRKE